MKIVDFTDVDIYPKSYKIFVKNGKEVFALQSLIIENIERQQNTLVAKKTQLFLGDRIKINLHFGHNIGKDKEEWMDVHVSGNYKVTKIIPLNNEIELQVKKVR